MYKYTKYMQLAGKLAFITYYIHDNGGRPFKVDITSYSVHVHRLNQGKEQYEDFSILTFEPQAVYIGDSPLNEMTKFSGGYGPEFNGNSILLHMGNDIYVFIGNTIFSFQALALIIKFVSPVGNNDVPYPYAEDKDGNIYLLIEDVVIKYNKIIKKQIEKNDNDPYRYYYDYSLITTNEGRIPPLQPKIKNFNNIKKFLIGKDQYTLRYEPNPEKDYDRVIPELGDKMFIIDTENNKIELTKSMFIELMESFGKEQGFEKIKYKIVHYPRII